MQQQSKVEVDVVESHITVIVPPTNGTPQVGDANQFLFDHPHPLVKQWIMVPDKHTLNVVWIRKRALPVQFYYCGPGITIIPIDQGTLSQPSILVGVQHGDSKLCHVTHLPPITTMYVQRFNMSGEVFYARRLLTNSGKFASKYWGVHHLTTGVAVHECADDCAAGALERVSLAMAKRGITEEALSERLLKFSGGHTMLWKDYLLTRTEPLSAFDAGHRDVIKARKGVSR